MHTTKTIVDRIPIGYDRHISDTIKLVVEGWHNTDKGKWCKENSITVYCDGVDDMHEDLGGLVNIAADFNTHDAVVFRLTFGK
jgi:hypothetical protein